MTVDEEFSKLEDSLRRLKIEFDIYFNGASPRPPNDLQWRVETIIKKYGDSQNKLTFAQRFRYNALVQRYAVYNDMWRQKVKSREEGREIGRRRVETPAPVQQGFKTEWHDPEQEPEKVQQLFNALVAAKKKAGESTDSLPIEGFQRFVKQKTEQLKRDFGCQSVEYVVEIENGQVRLKARGNT